MPFRFNPLSGEFDLVNPATTSPHLHVDHEEISGTGTAFTLANAPTADSEHLYMNTLRLRQVAATPGLNEYTISGASITLGFSKGAGDYFVADYDYAYSSDQHSHISNYALTGTGTSFNLPETPTTGSEKLYFNLLRLRRVTSSPGINEYMISGVAITLGFSKGASDMFIADYSL